MKILGISAYYHDAAAALTIDGQIVAAAQEEWFSRMKHDPGFPGQAIEWCLRYGGVRLEDLDAVAFYDKPFLKFERLLETYYDHAPRGWRSFAQAMPIWLKEKLFLKRVLRRELKALFPNARRLPQLLFPEHHLSHAASAFFPSPYAEAAVLTIDGVGEWATASICHGALAPDGSARMKILKELTFPDSLGLFYSAGTYYAGFKVNSGEYKLMGLAPYGQPEAEQTLKWVELMKDELMEIRPDGSVRLNQAYFRYAVGDRMVHEARWEQLLGIPPRRPEAPLTQDYCNLALALQMVTEEAVLKMAAHAAALTGCRQLCLAGGVALNCVANGKLLRSGIVDDLWIQPAAGDAGGALGAALAAHYLYFKAQGRPAKVTTDGMQGAYLGPEFSDQDIALVARKYQAACQRFDDFDVLARHTAQLLADGQVVGWYQGRQEFGPRALGSRSILGDARNPEMQRRLNLKIKFREGFRPFAPSVLAEEAERYFQLDRPSPYMLLVAPVRDEHRRQLPAGYAQMPMRDKLDVQRSTLPAITHIDFSARIQTVHADTNPRYYRLIQAFKEATGQGLVVNTSFNVRGEPVVCSPEEAFRCFVRTQMDYLVMGNYLFDKSKQPDNPLMQEAAAESFNLD